MNALILAIALIAPNDAATRAEEHFAAKEYGKAIEALEEAYANEPDPAFIFAQGSAYQEWGKCEEAMKSYERFLSVSPPKEQAQKAYDRIQECRSELAKESDAVPAPAPEDEPKPEPKPEPEPEADPKPWHRDILAGVLLGVGLGLGGTGGALIGVGARRRTSADDAGTEGDFRGDVRSGNVLQGVGIGLAVTGGALVVGAVVRYAILRRKSPDRLSGLTFRF